MWKLLEGYIVKDPKFWQCLRKVLHLIITDIFLTSQDEVRHPRQVLARPTIPKTGIARPTIPKDRHWPDRADFGHHWPDWTDIVQTIGQTVVQTNGQTEKTLGQTIVQTVGQTIRQTVVQTIGQTEQILGQTISQTHLNVYKHPIKFIIYSFHFFEWQMNMRF